VSAAKSVPFDIGQAMNEARARLHPGELRDAEKILTRVLKAAPDYYDALNMLGAVKAQLGRFGEAQRLLAAAVRINPGVPAAFANLGQVLHALKRDQEALECFDKALALEPQDVAVLNHRGNTLLGLGRPQEALAAFQQVLARAPHHIEAALNSGVAQAKLGHPDEAIAAFDRALALAPANPAAHYNRGVALFNLGRHADAIAAHDRALARVPDHAGAWLNRGQALAALNRLDEALASYAKANELRKDHPDTLFNEALALLTSGDYRRGFARYEARWRRSGMPAPRSRGRPLWLGEYPPSRKTMLIHAEQGLGDSIQFARYVPLLARQGAKVVLEVQPELVTIMARLEGAAAVIARGAAPPPFDLHCPLGSLPLAFHTELASIPAQVPYLAADDPHLAKWSERMGKLARPRIAIAWSGHAAHVNDRNRSIAFAALQPLFGAHSTASFVGIQREVRGSDAGALAAARRVTPVGDALEDFADTAAVIALADLVITVDTAVAHLAGAMAKPVWVLLPFQPDWRWSLGGETTPWYPTARLFRQPAIGDWASVVARVGIELARFR